ncbi:MAG: 50S ribosomal protein L9 [Peptococcaceae bacterium]|nr:50S ribosomal protein L9 [Peptococcaceae bacterium]
MKVVLLEDVKGQGKKGDVVNVAEGHARNFLLPRKLAVEATPVKLREISQQKAASERQRSQELEKAKEMGTSIEGLKVTLKAKVGEGGKLFGAIGNKDVAEGLLEQHGLNIDKKKIILKDPIKTLGEHEIVVKLHSTVQANILVSVEAISV